MKMIFRLFDRDRAPLNNAIKLRIILPSDKNKEDYNVLLDVKDGVAQIDIKRNALDGYSLNDGAYVIQLADFKTYQGSFGGTTDREKGFMEFAVFAKELPLHETQIEIDKEVPVVFSVKTDKGWAVKNAQLSLRSKGAQSEIYTTDNNGNISLSMLPERIEALVAGNAYLTGQYEGMSFISKQREGPTEMGGIVNFLWTMSAAEVTPDQPGPEDAAGDVVPARPPTSLATVSGRVLDGNNQPVNKRILRAVHREIGREIELEKAVTDSAGRYTITYDLSKLPKEAKSANLIIHLMKSKNVTALSSPLISGAKRHEVVNFSLGSNGAPVLTLFDRLELALADVAADENFAEMTGNDAELIAARYGESKANIATYLATTRLVAEWLASDIPRDTTAAVFAWLYSEIEPRISAISAKSDIVLADIITTSITRLIIPKINIKAVIADLRTSGTGVDSPYLSLIIRLLALAGIAEKHAQPIAGVLTGDIEGGEQWKEIAAIVGADDAQRLRAIVGIWLLLNRNIDLTEGVVNDDRVKTFQDLATLSEETLSERITATRALPADWPGKSARAKLVSYTEFIMRRIETRLPHDTFVEGLRAAKNEIAAGIGNMLRAQPDLDFSQRQSDVNEADAIVRARTIYLVCPVFRRAATAAILLGKDITEARDIVDLGRAGFHDRFSKPLDGKANADAVFDRAKALVGAIDAGRASALSRGDTSHIPSTLRGQLFNGSVSTSCTHCASLLSPGAYLVDLFAYISLARTGNGAKTGRDVLRARRPDLELVEVSCANADTVQPYINLVLEVLEDQVAPPSQTALARQTRETSSKLKVWPEHVNTAAYETLNNKVFPWVLAFDRDFAITEAMLQRADTSLAEVRAATGQTAGTLSHSAARLAVTKPGLLGLPDTDTGLLESFGVSNMSKLQTVVSTLSGLARHLQIDPTDALALLDTNFVRNGAPPLVNSDGSLADAARKTPTLARFECIGRLQARTKLPLAELDAMLDVIGAPAARPTADWLESLADVKDLCAALDISAVLLVQVLKQPKAAREEAFAQMLRLDAADLAWLCNYGGHDLRSPSGAWGLVQSHARMNAAGLSIGDTKALVTPPLRGTIFAPDRAQVVLKGLLDTFRLDDSVILDNDTGRTALNDFIALVTSAENDPEIDALAKTQQAISEALSSAFGVKIETATAAVTWQDNALLWAIIGRDTAPGPVEMTKLWKSLVFCDLTGLSYAGAQSAAALAADLKTSSPVGFPVTSGDGIAPHAGFMNLLDYITAGSAQFDTPKDIFEWLADLSEDLTNAGSRFADLTGRDAAIVTEALGAGGFDVTSRGAFFTRGLALRLCDILALCAKLETGPLSVFALAKAKSGDAAKNIVAATFPETAWPEVGARIMAPVLEASRDALLAHIIHNSPTYQTPLDVFNTLLIDVEMSACYMTSRIKQAIASLQQFVQRITLELEGTLALTEELAREWDWRKNYRVWEANRKVFFYPENWLEPELRDNKTEQYQQLESALLQGDINAETAEKALMNYARALHSVASLEPAGLLEDTELNRTHAFARSREIPHVYYRNTRESNGIWGGWAQIDLDIEGNHFLPVTYNGRTFLFWAHLESRVNAENEEFIFALATLEAELEDATTTLNNAKRSLDDLYTKRAEAESKVENNQDYYGVYDMLVGMYDDIISVSETAVTDGISNITAKKTAISELNLDYTYLEVSLSWSQEHRLTGWSQPKRSKTAISTKIIEEYDGELQHWRYPEGVFLRRVVEGDKLSIEVRSDRSPPNNTGGSTKENTYHFGDFVFDVVNDALLVKDYDTTPVADYMPTLVSLFARDASTYHRLYDMYGFRRVTGLDASELLMYGEEYLDNARVVSATRHYDAPDQAGMILGMSRRNYLIEPTTRFPTVAASGAITQRRPTARASGKVSAAKRASGSEMMVVQATDQPLAHQLASSGDSLANLLSTLDSVSTWRFTTMHHPFSDIIITSLYRDGLDGLYRPATGSSTPNAGALTRQAQRIPFFENNMRPSDLVNPDYPVDDFTFNRSDPYAIYNWELFFHAPLAIAKSLGRNRKFSEAQRWFHFIFNPLQKDGPRNASVWRLRPFWEIHKLLQNGDYDDLAALDAAALDRQAAEWLANPFNPHAVARLRSVAYMRATFMAYLDNLIAWADDLFARDTMEAIAEATQLYVIVAQLLGQRPQTLPALEGATPASVANMLDGESGPVLLPGTLPTELPTGDPVPVSPLFARFGQLCLPSNDRLLDFWSTLEDRLFKIRHCMNIEGVVRQLPLYQPPIDPALLVRAAAAGVSISDVVNGLSAPLPAYRFTYMQAKAMEFAADVRALGASLLSALEKKDAEALAQLRSDHEATMAVRMYETRKDRVTEAEAALEAAGHAVIAAVHTQSFYMDQIARGLLGAEHDEVEQLKKAHRRGQEAQVVSMIGGALGLIPQIGFDGPMPLMHFGGIQLAAAANAISQGLTFAAAQHSYNAGLHARSAQNQRRAEDWQLQKNRADRDVARAEQDQIAAEIRLEIAKKELDDQDRQRAHAAETAAYLSSKFTNTELYTWMVDDLMRLHYQAYSLAVSLAQSAQACWRDELDQPGSSFITFGHFDSQRKGLLAGERLMLDLRRMEAAYIAANKRGAEMRKSISLARLNPAALLKLRQGQTAAFTVPEFLFDLDAPGHFNRRIKTVSLSIPALAGPQTGVPCQLKLAGSYVRTVADVEADLTPGSYGTVITASGAQDDAGLFQVDFRDERYLPFEGAGAISSWELRLPDPDLAQFDYATISDVVLNISYTAKAGPDPFRDAVSDVTRASLGRAIDAFDEAFAPAQLLSLRHDFTNAWALIRAEGPDIVPLDFGAERFPYLFAGRRLSLDHIRFHFADGSSAEASLPGRAPGVTDVPIPAQVKAAVQNGANDVLMVLSYSVE